MVPPPEGRDAAAARDLAISEAQEKVDSYMAHDSYTGVVDAIDAEVNSGTAQLGRLAQPLQRTPGPRASRPGAWQAVARFGWTLAVVAKGEAAQLCTQLWPRG